MTVMKRRLGYAVKSWSENDADEQLLSRRRQRRTKKRSPKAEGGSADAVRMYLREIGQVDLLTIDDERRLAPAHRRGQNRCRKN